MVGYNRDFNKKRYAVITHTDESRNKLAYEITEDTKGGDYIIVGSRVVVEGSKPGETKTGVVWEIHVNPKNPPKKAKRVLSCIIN